MDILSRLIILYVVCTINAQASSPNVSDFDAELPELPTFKSQNQAPSSTLPVLNMPTSIGNTKFQSNASFLVEDISFTGNKMISNDELHNIAKEFKTKRINESQLIVLKDRITQEYISKGYLNSGVALVSGPDPGDKAGKINVDIIEGKLIDIRTKTDGRLNPEYISSPLRRSAEPVANVFKLEERLRLLQMDERIQVIDARFVPSSNPGEAILDVSVKENSAFGMQAEINNHISPNIGAEGVRLTAQHDNLSGSGNQIVANINKTLGFSKLSLKYSQPIIGSDSRVEFFASASESKVVDDNFDHLDIKDQSQAYRLSFREANIINFNSQFDWVLSGFYQHGQTYILNHEPFSYELGRDESAIDLLGITFGGDWISRQHNQVIVTGFSTSVSFPLPDDDDNDEPKIVDAGVPDGTAFIANGHFQWAQKLSLFNARFISRLDLQLSNAPLYGVQQFALGGHGSIRGYRENTLVRDNGVLGSAELRIPFYVKAGTRMSIALFADGGRAWQTQRDSVGRRVLASVGSGIVGKINKRTQIYLYYAKSLRSVNYLGESNLQEKGLHFSLSSSWR